MIKINLANAPTAAAAPTLNASLGVSEGFVSTEETRKEGVKRLLIMLLPVAGLYAYQMQNIPQKQGELSAKTKVLNDLTVYNGKASASVAEIKKFKEDQEVIEARIAALDKISKDRRREIRVLDLIQLKIPEKAWTTQIKIVSEKVTIQGLALSNTEYNNFMQSLSRSVFLVDVLPGGVTETTVDGTTLLKFELSCLLEKQ
ncbi:MAG TPA: PilN domain-containing protein, partial [Bdellovibrio sp.]|nr:PilN domain-containing protein [Bdellovibrio sp.]